MPLPATVQVKISSEAAGYASVTPVVVQDIELARLITYIAAAAGTAPTAVSALLERGVVVFGASRFRWKGFTADARELAELLAAMPSDDPSRPFSAERCVSVTFVSEARRFRLPREVASRRRLFRQSFWKSFLDAAPAPSYVRYLHSEGADLYTLTFGPPLSQSLHRLARLLPDRGAAKLLSAHPFARAEFLVAS